MHYAVVLAGFLRHLAAEGCIITCPGMLIISQHIVSHAHDNGILSEFSPVKTCLLVLNSMVIIVLKSGVL
jgi:hypothetical protein